MPQDGASLAVVGVLPPGAPRDYFATGSGGGFLNLTRYDLSSEYFTFLQRLFVGGEVTTIVPWLGPGAPAVGLIAATRNPDRLLFVRVEGAFPYFLVEAEIDLDEDPGDVVFVGDLVGGDPELAVALPGIDRVDMLVADNGTWSIAARIPTGDSPASLVGIDLDGDGIRELVAAQSGALSQTLGVFRRQADGSYPLETKTLTGVRPSLVGAFDLDDDGRLELAVADDENPVIVFYEEDSGTLSETSRAVLSIPAEAMRIVAMASGIPALYVSSGDRGLLEFLTYGGGEWFHQETYHPGCRPRQFTLADINGDGYDDLISAGGDEGILTTMLAEEDLGFEGFPAFSLDRNPGSFINEDIDGDGWLDLLLSDGNEKSLSLQRGTPGGALDPTVETLELGFIPGYILAANLDDDVALELAVLDILAEEIAVVEQDGPSVVELSRTPVGDFPYFIAAADLDDDDAVDLMVLSQDLPEVAILYGSGDGTIDQVSSLGFEYPAHRLQPMDLNGDGRLDLAASDASSRVGAMLNFGSREFGEETVRSAGSGALAMASGDLDGDLDDDLVVANRNDNSLTFFENDGSGSLETRILKHRLPGQPMGIALEDFDQDGKLDVLANLKNEELLGIVFNLADWSFSPALEVPGGPEMAGINTADFNQDGNPDILALDRRLLLGLILLNKDEGQVAVAPSALGADCRGADIELRVRPDRPGPWRVELKLGEAWETVMANGRVFFGEMDLAGETWVLRIEGPTLAERGQVTDGPLAVRLTVGEGASQESEIRSFTLDCARGENAVLPRLAWQREPWPNPFNPRVKAEIVMRQAGRLRAAVYDLAGREMATLVFGEYPAGIVPVSWDGRSANRPVGAGLYLLRAETPGGLIQRKVLLVK